MTLRNLAQFEDLKNIAIGSGFGFRYDFNFLIFRLDLGFKTYEPYLQKNKWFQHYKFQNAQYTMSVITTHSKTNIQLKNQYESFKHIKPLQSWSKN